MSHDAHQPPDPVDAPHPRLEAYLDGLLEGEALASFERELEHDPDLRAQVEAQHSINDALGRMFLTRRPIQLRATTDPTLVEQTTVVPPPAATTSAIPIKHPARRWTTRSSALVAIAATLALTFAGLYITGWIGPGDFFGQGRGLISPLAVYKRKVEKGFHPDWVCEDDKQFIETTEGLWGESLLVRGTNLVEVVGWSYYENVLSPTTAILLTRVEGREVIVIMDKESEDRTLKVPSHEGLNLFRDVKGKVVLYELTPFKEPRVLPLVEHNPLPLK